MCEIAVASWRRVSEVLRTGSWTKYKVDWAGATTMKQQSAKCKQHIKYTCRNGASKYAICYKIRHWAVKKTSTYLLSMKH